jgi:hypothetical protein
MPEKQKALTVSEVERSIDQYRGTLTMQSQLRQAIFDAISEQDVAAIVKKQVEKAKEGDAASLQFVMKYVLGFGQNLTLQQINVVDVETAARLAKSGGK